MHKSELSSPPAGLIARHLDMILNLGSLGFLALAGLVLNAVIARVYGAGALGLFNIVFALYIFASQFGAGGYQYAVLRNVAGAKTQRARQAAGRTAFVMSLRSSLLTTLIAMCLIPVIAWIYPIEGLRTAWLAALPGLFCFSLNKVLLAMINGMSRMRLYAGLVSVRFVLVLLILGLLVTIHAPSPWLFVSISGAEVLLTPVLLYVTKRLWSSPARHHRRWRAYQSAFALKALPSGIMSELNTRVDVLLLGAMMGDVQAGIYSIAILLAEGYGQAVQVIRTLLNPRLVTLVARKDQGALSRLVRTWGLGIFALMMGGGRC
jgi:O-antigen/teichoic acid export membrane protein